MIFYAIKEIMNKNFTYQLEISGLLSLLSTASYRAEYFGMLNNSGYENQKKYFIPKIIRTFYFYAKTVSLYRYSIGTSTVLSRPIFDELVFIKQFEHLQSEINLPSLFPLFFFFLQWNK